jgi:hypothetical protein
VDAGVDAPDEATMIEAGGDAETGSQPETGIEDAPEEPPPPPPRGVPRLIAPLSTATVTSSTPTLHWRRPPGVMIVEVDICRDRACAQPIATFQAMGDEGAPPEPLPPGVVFWRVTATFDGMPEAMQTSPVWEFTVGHRSAPHDASWGTTLDVNGDGFADAVVGGYPTALAVYFGAPGGLPSTPNEVLALPTPSAQLQPAVSAGDVNGDGYADLAVAALNGKSGSAVYVYLGSGSGLSSTPATVIPSSVWSLGSAGDINGDGYADLVVAGEAFGAVQIYEGSASGLGSDPVTAVPSAGPMFGQWVGSGCDVNGDDFGDIVVGYRGQTLAYFGGPGGIPATPSAVMQLPFPGDEIRCGDVNGDGFGDVAVDSPVAATGPEAAYVFFGNSGGVSSTPNATLVGLPSMFSTIMDFAGDVNGDGFDDIVMGSQGDSAQAGRVLLFLGNSGSLATSPAMVINGLVPNGYFGRALAGAGDVNGDGYADVLVGAPFDSGGGRAYLYEGGLSGLPSSPSQTLSVQMLGSFGTIVARKSRGQRFHPR